MYKQFLDFVDVNELPGGLYRSVRLCLCPDPSCPALLLRHRTHGQVVLERPGERMAAQCVNTTCLVTKMHEPLGRNMALVREVTLMGKTAILVLYLTF